MVLRGRDGVRFSKNGGVPGIHAFIEHLPNGVDWVVFLNGGEHQEGKPSPLGYCTKRMREAIGARAVGRRGPCSSGIPPPAAPPARIRHGRCRLTPRSPA